MLEGDLCFLAASSGLTGPTAIAKRLGDWTHFSFRPAAFEHLQPADGVNSFVRRHWYPNDAHGLVRGLGIAATRKFSGSAASYVFRVASRLLSVHGPCHVFLATCACRRTGGRHC